MNDQSNSRTSSGSFWKEPFPDPTLERWRELAEAALRGRPLEKLTVTIDEGVTVRPLYTAEDVPQEAPPPGFPPFTRGTGITGEVEVCAPFDSPPLEHAAERIAVELGRGATSIAVRLSEAARAGLDPRSTAASDGLPITSAEDFRRLFEKIDLQTTPVHLEAGGAAFCAAASFLAAARERGDAPERLRGSFNFDPLGALIADGRLSAGIDRSLDLAAALARWCAEKAPGIRAAAVSAVPYHEAGCTPVQELALALAGGIDTLRAFEQRGLSPDEGALQIRFLFPVGRDFFVETAKLRAFRTIWARALDRCGVEGKATAAQIHTATSRRILTRRDPWVNILRATVGVFAAMAGGADIITTLPFDCASGPSDDDARRLALNTQTILREESRLLHVVDPGGGSWYLESLTDELARAAWKRFREIEARGGFRRLVLDGGLSEMIGPPAERARRAVATRAMPITGVSTWPNLAEEKLVRPLPDAAPPESIAPEVSETTERRLEHLGEAVRNSGIGPDLVDAAVEAAAAGVPLHRLAETLRRGSRTERTVPLTPIRDAEAFERLRDASDETLRTTGRRPAIFLANLGPIAEHRVRATFARNLFEAGGVEAIDQGGFTNTETLANAFEESGAPFACICSSDARYESDAEEAARTLRRAGARRVFLAGRPGANEARWREAGVDRFVFAGCDALDVLEELIPGKGASS